VKDVEPRLADRLALRPKEAAEAIELGIADGTVPRPGISQAGLVVLAGGAVGRARTSSAAAARSLYRPSPTRRHPRAPRQPESGAV
jgi:hypothetical protein